MTKQEIRQIVYNKYNGKCAYCGSELPAKWHIDHIEPVVRNSKYDSKNLRYVADGTCRGQGSDVLSNYNPACPSCNIQKNSFTIEQFRQNIMGFLNSLNQYSTQYKFAKRYGLIRELETDVIFYFEKQL